MAGHTIPALAADLTRDPGLAAEFRTRFTEPRKRAVIEVLQRGVEAGHVHPGADLASSRTCWSHRSCVAS